MGQVELGVQGNCVCRHSCLSYSGAGFKIEAYLQILLFSCMVNIIGPGVKTLVKGGGYGEALGFASTNASYLSEGAALSTVAILLVP